MGWGLCMRVFIVAAIGLALAALPARAANQKDWNDCLGKDAEASIAGCTRVLQDSKLTVRQRAEALYNRGLAYKATSDTNRALADYSEAIRTDPTWAIPYAKRGDLYDDKGDDEHAIADLTEAIRLDPQYAWAYAIRGYVYDQQRKLDLAIADYSEAIRLDPKDVGTIANRGWAKRKQGDLDGALADFDEAIRVDPTFVRAYYNRGLAWNDRNQYERALADFNEAIKLAPKNDIAYHDRGLTRFYTGDYAGAADDLKRSNDLKPESFTALRLYIARARAGGNALAELQRNAGQFKSKDWPRPILDLYLGNRTANDMITAAKSAEQRCDAQFYLAEWLLLHNKRDDAIASLRAAMADECPKYLFEYVAAVVELKRLGQ